MGRLKQFLKIKIIASSITEVIVATTILLTVFGIAMLALSNIMTSSVKKDTSEIETEVEKLMYGFRNNPLKIPYSYSEDTYIVNIQKIREQHNLFIEFTIRDSVTKISVTKKRLINEKDN